MARQRDYAKEYRQRIERGQRLGLTRKEARGHAGELTRSQREAGAVAVKRGLEPNRVSSYLGTLGESRRAKVLVTWSDGTHQVLIGKKGGQRPSGAKRRIEELIEEFGSLEAAAEAEGYRQAKGGMITSVNVVYA